MEDSKPIIIIGNKWPLIIKGGVTLIHPDGLEEQRTERYTSAAAGFLPKNHFVTAALTRDVTLSEQTNILYLVELNRYRI